MKSKNFLSNLWSSVAGSQRNDVEFDRRLTVGSPSGFTINWTLKLVFVLVLVLTIGSGNVWADVTDEITASSLAATGTTYTAFSNVSITSDAKYAGQSAKDASGNIQLRSKNSNSGIVSTTSGGTVKSVKITVGSGSNTVDVYGSNTAYTSAADLYNPSKQGTKVGSVTSTGTVTFSSDYAYVGIRSNSGAIYLSKVEITWSSSGGSTPTITTSVSSLSEVGYSTADFSQQVKSFTVSGSNLTANVTVTAPTNYEVCKTSGGTYTSSVSFDKGSGTLAASRVYVRLQSGKTAGNYSGNVACSSSGATTKNVSVSGSVPFTVTWKANGTTHATTYVAVGSTLTLPGSNPTPSDCGCSGKAFYGWYGAGSSYSNASVAPTIAKAGDAVSADKTYYAVFADEEDGSSTSTLTASAQGWSDGNNATTKTISTVTYTWAQNSGSSAPKYYATGTAVRLYPQTSGTNGCQVTISSANTITGVAFTYVTDYEFLTNAPSVGTLTAAGVWSGSATSITFKNKNNAQVRIQSIVVTYGSTTYSNYATTCCTQLASINESVNWSNGTQATLSWDDIANVASWAVTAIDNTTSSAVAAGNITTPNDDGDTYSCVVSNLTAGHNYTFTIAATAESGYCDKSQEITATAPNITTSASSITGLEYIDGNGPSEAKSFTVSAAGLTGNLSVAAPTNFQVSTTSSTSGFGNSATLTPVSGSLTNATVWVRLTAGLSENTYGSASTYVTISGGGAANKNVSVQGLVSAACTAPTITAQPSGATYNLNTPATALSVTATGESLTYQWYSNTANNNTSGTIISGATNSKYTPATTTKGTIYYYCVVSSGACHTASNTATITVRTPSIATASPSVIAFGDKKVGGTYTATFTISATNLAYNTGLTLTLGGTARAYYSIDKTSIAQTSAGTVASTTVTVTYNPTAAGVHGAGANTYVTISSEGATSTSVTLSGTGKWEVTWKASGSDDQTTLVGNGERPTFPSAPSSCDGTSTTFIGWTKTAWTGKQTKTYVDGLTTDATKVHTSNSTMSTVTANGTTYHAVWAEGDIYWGRMTSSDLSSLAAGSKLVIVAVAQGYVLKNDLTNSNSVPSETAGVISPSSDLIWELAGSSGAWNIKSGSNTIGTQYNSCAGAGNGVVLLANNNHQSYSIGSSSHGTNEFYIKDNACDNGVLTKVSKYDDFRIVNVSSYSSAADAALKLYTQKGSYSNFMTTCCDKNITLSEPVITDAASSGATITFDETSPVATCEGETTVTATLTLPAGYEATALNFSGGSVSVSPEITLPVTTTTEYTLTFAQNTNATLTTTATVSAKPLNSITITPSSGEVYVGQYVDFTVSYDPADYINPGYTLNATPVYVTKESAAPANTKLRLKGGRGSGPGASITATVNETVTIKASGDNTKKASVNMTVNPLPRVHFVDLVHGKEFADVVATISDNALNPNKTMKTSVDWTTPNANDCEEQHLHLAGWILSTWADANPDATHSEIAGAGATNFYAPGAAINVLTNNGNTYYAVWAKEE